MAHDESKTQGENRSTSAIILSGYSDDSPILKDVRISPDNGQTGNVEGRLSRL